jgi:hypothetical protein
LLLRGIQLGKPRQCIVQRNKVGRLLWPKYILLVQCRFNRVVALIGLSRPSGVHENSTHHLGRYGEEVGAIFPLHILPLDKPNKQEGSITSEWGFSENHRKARFYRLTRQGRKQLQSETKGWEQTAAIIARFFAAKAENFE